MFSGKALDLLTSGAVVPAQAFVCMSLKEDEAWESWPLQLWGRGDVW